jgi:predicted transcriptional regulator
MAKMMISARVDEKLNEQLSNLAETMRRPKAFLVTEALEDYVERQVWINKKIDDDFAAADASGEWIAHEEVEKWFLSLGTDNELPRPTAKKTTTATEL